MNRLSHALLVLAALGAVASSSAAQFGVVSGQVQDALGNPVAGAVFQVDPMSGNDLPFVSGGYTDANGAFTASITPFGDYRITIFPQPAPQSLVVVKRVENIAVSSTPNDLGTIVMQLGVQVSGRVVNTAGTPLVEVDLEFLAGGSTGEPLDFSNPHTDGLGRFTVAMPFGSSDLHFEPGAPPYYGGTSTAPLSLSLDLAGPRDLGDVVLPNGWGLSATLARLADGTPVEDAEVELIDSVTHVAAFVPKHKSDAFGSFSTTLAAGTYDMRIRPAKNDGLVAFEMQNLVFPPGGPLGTLYLQDGLTLSGTVRGVDGNKRGGVAVTLVDSSNGASVFLGDPVLSKGNGSYEALVAAGTYDVTFSPPFTVPFGPQTVAGLEVSDDTRQDGTLPALPFFATFGTGVPGLGGITPTISATGGTPRIGNAGYGLNVAQARGGAASIVVYTLGAGPSSKLHTLAGGQGATQYRTLLRLTGVSGTPGAGAGRLALPIPHDSQLVGQTLSSWFLVNDPAAPSGRAATNELRVTLSL